MCLDEFTLHVGFGLAGFAIVFRQTDARRRLPGKVEFELVEEQLQVLLWMGVACHDDLASVAGGQVNIKHLQSRELLQHASGRESFGSLFESGF